MLVVGGAGFLGMHVSLSLAADGHDVVVLDRMGSPAAFSDPQAARQYSDLENTVKLRRLEMLRQSRVTLVQGSACDGLALSHVLNRTYTHVVYLAVPSDGAPHAWQRDDDALQTRPIWTRCCC